ncbi:MAG: hypothetical protein CSA11_01125 [Chloroflexi bacterium]|nr:MAG: hypothetical protein CSA11_01125 [Chloroflexota bacterium]
MTVMATEKTNVVGIRFQKLGKLYHFKVKDNRELEAGDHVIVETKRGQQLGQIIAYVPSEMVHKQKGMRYVQRKANPRGSWVTFHYTTENKSLDINPLKQLLNKSLRTRVEMRLIGSRDVAKIMGGFGACGAPRCCSTFLTEFSPISIRMAKEQGVSLSPQEITGMCGRLRCCLVFEYEQYVEAKKTLPRVGKMVDTPYGEGKVRDVRVLRDSVVVVIDGEWKEVFRHELEPLDELRALQDKAANGCDRHEGGGCDCGLEAALSGVTGQVKETAVSEAKEVAPKPQVQPKPETRKKQGSNSRRSRRDRRNHRYSRHKQRKQNPKSKRNE